MNYLKNILNLITLLCLLAVGCVKENNNETEKPSFWEITPITKSLVSIDHTAEGFIVKNNRDEIIHVFRIDIGSIGHHIGNNGGIAIRTSSDSGLTWSKPQVIYNDEFDDRNIHGGISPDGRIIIFFRRFEVSSYTWGNAVDTRILIIEENGDVCKDLYLVDEEGLSPGTSRLEFDNNNNSYMSFYRKGYVEFKMARDLSSFKESAIYTFDTCNEELCLDESCFCYLGDNCFVGIVRDQTGGNYVQTSSIDLGRSWSIMKRTNICNSYFTPSPLIYYDKTSMNTIVIAPDRREVNSNQKAENSQLWVYITQKDSVLKNPLNHELKFLIDRPIKSSHYFYGYPCICKINNDKFLVVFTDGYERENGLENANFYQFYLMKN